MTNTPEPPIDRAKGSTGKSWKLKYKRSKHGRAEEPEYESWSDMKRRCNNSQRKDYPNYGGRGITYNPAWEDFMVFFADMGPRPGMVYTLERKDSNGPYCKENCIWMLKSLQNRNQRNTKLSMEKAREIRSTYTAGGVTQRVLATRFGVSSASISDILQNKKWKEL